MKFCVFTLFISFAVLINFSNGTYAPAVRLSSNAYMPIVGLGTNSIIEGAENVVTQALNIGYRHFDDAAMYENEQSVGKALRNFFARGGRRQDLFVTSKLPAFGNRPADVERYLLKSLKDLGLSYVDMYLVHFPAAIKESREGFSAALNPDGSVIFDYDSDIVSVWKEMERQVKLGRARSIGLSNFNISQITRIMYHAEIRPSNLQIEIHPYHQQKQIRDFCNRYGIRVTAYAPLGSQSSRQYLRPDQDIRNYPNLFTHPTISRIASKYGKTNAQVILRHMLQAGTIVIPRSSNPKRLQENLNLFDFVLSYEDMRILDRLDMGEAGKIFDYKLVYKGIEHHREYPFAY